MHALICQVSKLIIKRSRNNEASVVRKLEKKIKILIQRHGRIWWRGWIPYCAFSSNGADGSGGYGFFEQGDDGSVGAQIADGLAHGPAAIADSAQRANPPPHGPGGGLCPMSSAGDLRRQVLPGCGGGRCCHLLR